MSDGGVGDRGVGDGGVRRWTVVIPIKGGSGAKSRLGGSPALALAIALDTVAAAAQVAELVVVTTPEVGERARGVAPAARLVTDPGAGLTAAIAAGIAAAPALRVAVLLGDLPALQPDELRAALDFAERHPRALVADADGDGSVLITALVSADHAPAFGDGSRGRHRAAGYAELPIDAGSGLRRDVDTPGQLAALAAAGRLGARTAAELGGSGR